MTKLKTIAERLTRREREIMNAVFALGNRASAEDIRGRLSEPPGDASVRVMLTRLEKKGFLKHQQEGLRYLILGNHLTLVCPAGGVTAIFRDVLWRLRETDDDRPRQRGRLDRRRTRRTPRRN